MSKRPLGILATLLLGATHIRTAMASKGSIARSHLHSPGGGHFFVLRSRLPGFFDSPPSVSNNSAILTRVEADSQAQNPRQGTGTGGLEGKFNFFSIPSAVTAT